MNDYAFLWTNDEDDSDNEYFTYDDHVDEETNTHKDIKDVIVYRRKNT